ncbi:hypothetical protein C5B96_13025 [Subtercola sp. Z020]|uniref:RNA polymerase sigma factor n=1 Tax=Subtercola sp. Z020 TaxID=2080582 RepID=UPI000CE82069|nr:sigma factor [Subtercola sp. Z020]PPF79350.1 hypothetical protein C5B96_13025 [Subtercola sp. Z020]
MVSLPGRESLSDADDRTVASRAADGDIRAFEILMKRYGSLMRAYAARIVTPSDADDVVQETFVTAWQDLPDLENPAAAQHALAHDVAGADLGFSEGAVRALVRDVGDETDGLLVERTHLDGDLEMLGAPVQVSVVVSTFVDAVDRDVTDADLDDDGNLVAR